MRRPLAVLTIGAAVCAVSACSPVVHGTAAVGLDAQGRLVGVLQPCDLDLTRAHLREQGATNDVVTWERSFADDGVQVWLLSPGRSLAWSRSGDLPALDGAAEYEFWVSADDDDERSGRVTFSGTDLTGLSAGQLLVPGEPTDGGEPGAVVLGLGEFDDVPC